MSRVEGLPAYPSYPGRANFSYISLQNLANRLHEKQKVGSARRVTRLAGSPFCDGGVTLLAGPTFPHIIVQSNWGQTLNKLQQKVFQRIMAHSDVLNNISKVPKNRSLGRPRKTGKKIPVQSLYEKPQGTQFI